MIFKIPDKNTVLSSPIWGLFLAIISIYIFSLYYGYMPICTNWEGDFGRDLYDYYLVSKGQWPYIDFNYIYGPLGPVLYGFIFKLFGVSILNALTFWYFIYIIILIILYFFVRSFSNSFLGFLASVTFIIYYLQLAHTFNHLQGSLFILLILIFTKKYLTNYSSKSIYLIGFSCFLLAITKLNMGIAISGVIFCFLIIFNYINKKPLLPVIKALMIFIVLTVLVYGVLLLNSPFDQLVKSFPYSKKYVMQFDNKNILDRFLSFEVVFMSNNYMNTNLVIKIINGISSLYVYYLLIPVGALVLAYFIYKKEKAFNTDSIFIIISAFVCLIGLHEFCCLGTYYSARQWSLITLVVLLFYCLNIIILNHKNKKAFMIAALLSFLIMLIFVGVRFYVTCVMYEKTLSPFPCPIKRAQVEFTEFPWYITMYQGIEYLQNNTSPEEKVFSLPYNMLYNFLSERDNPSRYSEYMYLSGITDKDEYKIINDLEKNKVRIILVSQKAGPILLGVGFFGKTHCKILDKYIKDNYSTDICYSFNDKNIKRVAPICFYKRKTQFK